MTTAIILTALVIAVGTLALCKTSGKCSKIEEQYKIEEQDSIEWARKYIKNKNVTLWCDDNCKKCDADRCPFREV